MLYEYAILFIFFKKPPIITYSKISLKQNLNLQTQTMRKSKIPTTIDKTLTP